RRQDWRPRGVRQQTHKLRDAVRELTRSLGREPTDEEILAHTGLSEEAYQGYLVDLSCEAIESLDGLLQAGQEGRFGDNGFEEQVQRERLLAQVLGRLPEREQLVLTLYYQNELSLKEIALVLELSDARICQLIKQAIQRACALLNEPNYSSPSCRKYSDPSSSLPVFWVAMHWPAATWRCSGSPRKCSSSSVPRSAAWWWATPRKC